MGMNIECMLYLQEKGLLTATKNKLLDIGPQNVYFCTEQQIRNFVRCQGAIVADEVLDKDAKRLEYFSTPRPEERTTLFSEIADLTNIEYHAFDVCPAPKTELLDLNFDSLPDRHREHYDVVLNFGTTEHIFNQWNCFTVIHDATKVGGIIYCVLPATGYLDHGYFCYTPLFFKDMARANEYDVVDFFLAPAGINTVSKLGLDVRADGKFLQPDSATLAPMEDTIRCLNAHIVMRKIKSAPLRCALEVATAHSEVNAFAAARYRDGIGNQVDELQREYTRLKVQMGQRTLECDEARVQRDEARAQLRGIESQIQQIYESRSWRFTAPVRALRARAKSFKGYGGR
jgi:hypothetical protein